MCDLVNRLRRMAEEAAHRFNELSLAAGSDVSVSPESYTEWKAADALKAKDTEIERLQRALLASGICSRIHDYPKECPYCEIERLKAVVDDIDRWLKAFIKAWDQNAPHKGSEAPVALMEAIRQHSLVRAALKGADDE